MLGWLMPVRLIAGVVRVVRPPSTSPASMLVVSVLWPVTKHMVPGAGVWSYQGAALKLATNAGSSWKRGITSGRRTVGEAAASATSHDVPPWHDPEESGLARR